ncbi:hypothetical protein ACROYT_G000479 [Oculina patagonica]
MHDFCALLSILHCRSLLTTALDFRFNVGVDVMEEVTQAVFIVLTVATFLLNTGRALKAIELCKELLIALNNKALGEKKQCGKLIYGAVYNTIFKAYRAIRDYTNAMTYGRKLLVIYRERGETANEGKHSIELAKMYQIQNKYVEAKELYERLINTTTDRRTESDAYGGLGTMFHSLGEYVKAREYLEKKLAIAKEIGVKKGEAEGYGNLGVVFLSLGEYVKAKQYLEKALAFTMESGSRAGEASCYGNLGNVFARLGKYDKAKEYFKKALAIKIEIGDREGKAIDYGNLGTVFLSLGEHVMAKEYLEKALAIRTEFGDRKGEATDYGNLGTVFQSVGEYEKAKEYYEKSLAIRMEIGDRAGEATDYGNLGVVFQTLGEYVTAKEYLEKALAIKTEIGDRVGEAAGYGNLGTMFHSLGEYVMAKENHKKALAIRIEIGDRKGEAADNVNLGNTFTRLKEYTKSNECLKKALAIQIEIADRAGQALSYASLGALLHSLGDYVKAKEYLRKALAINIEIGHRAREAENNLELGNVFNSLGEYVMAEECFKKALSISKNIGLGEAEFQCYSGLTATTVPQEKFEEALSYLFQSIKKCDELRDFLVDNDQFKISFSDTHNFPYLTLSAFFCATGNPENALYVVELGRARALADLMATQYSVEREISANPQSWIGIENVTEKESNCTYLYISFYAQDIFVWILKANGVIHFRRTTVDINTLHAEFVNNLDEYFAIYSSFGILPEEDCEDRSLDDIEPKPDPSREGNFAKSKDDPEPNLTVFNKMLIAPIAEFLEGTEIIILPDRGLYRVPFPALRDESGKYLSDTFRIRIVPSLTTLKLIQDSPADYHSQTGALIVGDPEVGKVLFKGRRKTFLPLPCAKKEAEMIGELLGVQPLLGLYATKQAVLEMIHSASLIHFAAHGNAERGEIALAPPGTTTGIPQEEDYLLTMSDISQVRLRAELVVLSCCHSGCGQIRSEGVVGIARAFLGSGARSVLVALWALADSATEHFMRRFYEHLVRGQSASESLHEAMKWMRDNGFAKVSEWAPFMLIGDNVTFDFGKLKMKP